MLLPSLTASPPLAWGLPVGYEWLAIGAVALLIFGKRLPGAARGIGQGILEFKKGLKGGQQEAEAKQIADAPANGSSKPRFDPETGKPLAS